MATPEDERHPSRDGTDDYGRLQLLFRRTSSLPQLPDTALKLIQLIDEGESGARQLERVISGDPGLVAEILRHAAISARAGEPPASIRQVIMALGQTAVRSVAGAFLARLSLQAVEDPGPFNPRRHAVRSTATAIVARFLYARAQAVRPFKSAWSPDDVFAAGLLLSLPAGLLASVAPDCFRKSFHHAMRAKISIEDAFGALYRGSLFELGAEATAAWRLPPLFSSSLSFFEEPWNLESEYVSLCCLNYANQLVRASPAGMEPWTVAFLPPFEVVQQVNLRPEEIEALMRSVQAHLRAYGCAPSE